MSPIIIGDEPAPLTADSATPVTPHFATPFTMNGGTAASVNEQDSLEDVFACVQTIVACPVGAWDDQPQFGIPSPLFARAPVDTSGMQSAIAVWEPRAETAAVEYPDLFNDAVRTVQITVATAQADQ